METMQINFGHLDQEYFTREAFKTLRTNLLFSGTDMKVICLTSCGEDEGKTTMALELAHTLAEYGKKVLVIDADMRKSVMANRYATSPVEAGLSRLLSGQLATDEVLYPTQMECLDIIFSGQNPPNPVELLGSNTMKKFLTDMRKKYDYVLIDTPPLGMVIDCAVLASYCDGALLVFGSPKLRHRDAKTVIKQLEKSGCRILGAILNHPQSEIRKSKKHP